MDGWEIPIWLWVLVLWSLQKTSGAPSYLCILDYEPCILGYMRVPLKMQRTLNQMPGYAHEVHFRTTSYLLQPYSSPTEINMYYNDGYMLRPYWFWGSWLSVTWDIKWMRPIAISVVTMLFLWQPSTHGKWFVWLVCHTSSANRSKWACKTNPDIIFAAQLQIKWGTA